MDLERIDREMRERNSAMAHRTGEAVWHGLAGIYFTLWSECVAEVFRFWEPFITKKEE